MLLEADGEVECCAQGGGFRGQVLMVADMSRGAKPRGGVDGTVMESEKTVELCGWWTSQ